MTEPLILTVDHNRRNLELLAQFVAKELIRMIRSLIEE